MPKLRKKSDHQKQAQDRERKRRNSSQNVSHTSDTDTNQNDMNIVQVNQSTQHFVFNAVDFMWQIQKCLDINTRFDIALNIIQNLQSRIRQEIREPTTCIKVEGDGNCFSRCIAYESFHTQVRQTVLHMCSSSGILTSLLPPNTTRSQYIARSRMSEDKVWATQAEIISTAHLLKTDIYTYSKYGHELKWLKHTALFVDNTLQINEKAVYLDHHTGIHFDVVLDVGTSVSSDSTAE